MRRSIGRRSAAAPASAPRPWRPGSAWTRRPRRRPRTRTRRGALAAGAKGAPTRRSSSPRTSGQTVRVLADIVIPRDERSGSATDAGVPEFMDFVLIDEPRGPRAPADLDARRAGLDRPRVPAPVRPAFVACTEAERTAVLDDISRPPRRPRTAVHGERGRAPTLPVLVARARLLQQLPRPDGDGLLDHEDGNGGPAVSGQPLRAEWKGCPDEALKKLGVSYSRS